MKRNESATSEVLARRVADLEARAIETNGEVDTHLLEEAERLARLRSIGLGLQPKPRRRWPVAAAFLATVAVGSLLAFGRMSSTEIELSVRALEVSLELTRDQVLMDGWPVAELGIVGARHLQLPREIDLERSMTSLRLTPEPVAQEDGRIRLGTVFAPAGTRVRVQSLSELDRYRVSLSGPPSSLQVDLSGPVRISAGSRRGSADFSVPRSLQVEWGEAPLSLDLEARNGSPEFLPELEVRGLSLQRIEEHAAGGGTTVRQPSTVLSGHLYYESLDGRSRQLRVHERLRFTSAKGQLHRLQLDQGALDLRFHGVVEGMRTGSDGNPRSLMPTWLEWLRARQGLALVWGAALYVVGLFAGLTRWMRAEA
jgi:hypothetical protein